MSPIKDLILTYEALNKEDTFSAGDTITGTLTFTLTKDTKVKKLSVKAKGRAHVHWTEGTGDRKKSYTAQRDYFKAKKCFVEKSSNSTVLSQGDHCHKFSFKIPQGDMPPSFKGFHGTIVYKLEAKMSRSWKLPSIVQKELKFVSKSSSYPGQCPLSGSVEKGQVQMSATIDKKVCCPGDTISIVAKICNNSSKKMKPKFSLEQKIVYRAHSSTKVSLLTFGKVVEETIEKNSEETVTSKLTVPVDAIYTISNCEIISVNYHVKAYLDISFAFDPEVVFPVVIVPAGSAYLNHDESMGPYPAGPAGAPGYSDFPPPAFPTGPYPEPTGPYSALTGPGVPFQSGQAPGPYPAGPFGASGYSNFPPPAFPTGHYPAPSGPGTYRHPPPDPSQQASGYNNPWPQQAPPYGYPTPAFPPSSVPQQAPTAPPMFQQGEDPPMYKSLYPTPP
uniref:arrestin domain-containing protein 3-like n=1 Tax=Semicossyphus pulcher TaxID=241346 RepID=UPI0037E98BAD